MKDLIEALTIMGKYMVDDRCPTRCEHDVLMVAVQAKDISKEDLERLDEMSL